jgi:hypothetical protein
MQPQTRRQSPVPAQMIGIQHSAPANRSPEAAGQAAENEQSANRQGARDTPYRSSAFSCSPPNAPCTECRSPHRRSRRCSRCVCTWSKRALLWQPAQRHDILCVNPVMETALKGPRAEPCRATLARTRVSKQKTIHLAPANRQGARDTPIHVSAPSCILLIAPCTDYRSPHRRPRRCSRCVCTRSKRALLWQPAQRHKSPCVPL